MHCDLNNFYASVECVLNPYYDGLPLAVCGNPEKRHGIVLAKNMLAKKAGVTTGEPIWQSKQKCPNIVFVSPHFEHYVEYSNKVRQIYETFTDKVESFGLDECWLDVTHSLKLFCTDGKGLADKIRETVKKETGLTLSVGVSFTKVLSKLGSDLKKPDATTVLSRENYMSVIGSLPPSDLIMIGSKTSEKLHKLNIHTIYQLSKADRGMLKEHFGIIGGYLVDSAMGIEREDVKNYYDKRIPKSVSNGTTTPRDMTSMQDAKTVIYALCELVAVRMRKFNLVANGISLSIKYANLEGISKHKSLDFPTSNASDLADAAVKLLSQMHAFPAPLRAITVGAIRLEDKSVKQLNIFDDDREERLEESVDKIRSRYGYDSIKRGVVVLQQDLTGDLHEEDGFEPFKR